MVPVEKKIRAVSRYPQIIVPVSGWFCPDVGDSMVRPHVHTHTDTYSGETALIECRSGAWKTPKCSSFQDCHITCSEKATSLPVTSQVGILTGQ